MASKQDIFFLSVTSFRGADLSACLLWVKSYHNQHYYRLSSVRVNSKIVYFLSLRKTVVLTITLKLEIQVRNVYAFSIVTVKYQNLISIE